MPKMGIIHLFGIKLRKINADIYSFVAYFFLGKRWKRAKKKSEFEDTDLGNESYNFLTKTCQKNFNKRAIKCESGKKGINAGKKKSEFEDTDLGNES